MTTQEDIDKRYMDNFPVAEKIAELLGLRIISFNPSWRFEPLYDEVYLGQYSQGYVIPNDFIGKLALILGYNWEFDQNDEEVEEEIKKSEDYIRDIQLRSEETIEAHKRVLDLIKNFPDIATNSSILTSMESIRQSNKSTLEDTERYLAKKRMVLEIRDKLKINI